MTSADICTCDGECLILPLIEGETRWPEWVRGILYAVGMAYCFIGVSIIADIFMGAIEAITSRRKQVQLPTGKIVTRRIWNDTVANLTLMALGSSAPEILLSVIDLFKRDMSMGELGPQTIVGSASFNLFMIVGLCIMVIPSTESRQVRQVQVYIVTTIFMFFAYIWLALCVSVISPGIIDVWEAAVTLLALPVLVVISFLADTGRLTCFQRAKRGESRSVIIANDVNKLCELLGNYDKETREACKLALALRPKGAPPLSELSPSQLEQIKKQVQKGKGPRKSRAARRVEATRALTGGRRISYEMTSTFQNRGSVAGVTGISIQDLPLACAKGEGKPTVQFVCASQTLSAELGTKEVLVKRDGQCNPDITLQLYYAVNPVTLKPMSSALRGSLLRQAGSRASSIRRPSSHVAKQCLLLEMGAQELVKAIPVPTPTPEASDQLVGFMVDLIGLEVKGRSDGDPSTQVELGSITCTEVDIGKAEANGILCFCFERVMVQGTRDKQIVEVLVQRQCGCSGTVSCSYRTERLSAVPGHDYQEADGELVFGEGVTEQFVEIEILPKGKFENKDEFLVVLENAEGGATFKASTDGGEDAEICTVSIATLNPSANSRYSKFLRRVDAAVNIDALRLGSSEWRDAFIGAVYCNGSPEEQAEATKADWVFHIIALPWKLFFSLVPPTAYFHGWLCFWISLLFLGFCTGLIGDLAELFGCVLRVDDTITAIIFVALGTSMPDLFASRTAATQDPFADASIVNVTGSNSVNVFLGLGLPWTMGSIYWVIKGRTPQWASDNPVVALQLRPDQARFTVPTRGIPFSVTVFSIGALVAIFLLSVRRKVVGAELGGPFRLKLMSFITFTVLWVVDIGMVSWYQVRGLTASGDETAAVFSVSSAVVVALGGLTLLVACQTARSSYVGSEGTEENDRKESKKDEGVKSAAMQDDFKDARSDDGLKSSTSQEEAAPHQEIPILQDGGVRCSV